MGADYALGESIVIQNRLEKADRYYQWIYSTVEPFLGDRVLEVGCGLGHFTPFLLHRERIVSIDVSKTYVDTVSEKYKDCPSFAALVYDILDQRIVSLKTENFDTVVCLNVLEHIEDDRKALRQLREVLQGGGRLILLVPALKVLYGEMDRADRHWRRYTRDEILSKAVEAGFQVEKITYFNLVGSFAWFLNGRILKRQLLPERQLGMFNRLVPLLSKLESAFPVPFGQSLILIGHRN